MSVKSLIQIFILLIIILLVGFVYYKYFNINNKIIEESKSYNSEKLLQLKELEEKITNLELKNYELNKILETENIKSKETKKYNSSETQLEINEHTVKGDSLKLLKKNINNEVLNATKEQDLTNNKKKIKNLVKDVEYTSIDQKGNKFYLLATSGKSNIYNNDILDLDNVRGKITSEIRETIYIVSDFGQYNSINLNSKFYENVIINYQDKEITCVNFDINMVTNKAIAYNDVVITDPKSVMKAGIVEFDLKTKNVNINPISSTDEIRVITN